MMPQLHISAMDLPTILYILHNAGNMQQMNLLPENASQNDAILPKSLCILHILDHLAMFKFLWSRNHRTI